MRLSLALASVCVLLACVAMAQSFEADITSMTDEQLRTEYYQHVRNVVRQASGMTALPFLLSDSAKAETLAAEMRRRQDAVTRTWFRWNVTASSLALAIAAISLVRTFASGRGTARSQEAQRALLERIAVRLEALPSVDHGQEPGPPTP